MVAVLAAFGAAFLIWFHHDPKPSATESACQATEIVTTTSGPWYDEIQIQIQLQGD